MSCSMLRSQGFVFLFFLIHFNQMWGGHRKSLETIVHRNQCPARVFHASIGHWFLVPLCMALGIVRVVRYCVVETTGSSRVLLTVYSCTFDGYAIVRMFRLCSLVLSECLQSIHKWNVHCSGFYATLAAWLMRSSWACLNMSWAGARMAHSEWLSGARRNQSEWLGPICLKVSE